MIESNIIALTGATGFIGTALIRQLTHAGWHVRALYRPKKGRTPPNLPNVQWLAGDIQNSDSLNMLVTGTHAVIHCAGAVRGASRADFDWVNEEGALRVAKAAELAHTSRFLLVSSLAARMPELSDYAGSKWRGENAIKATASNMRWTIIRPPAVYGPGDKELLPLFRSMAKGFAPLPAGANGQFSMIYVDDLAAAIVSWLNSSSADEQTFELDDGRIGGYDWNAVLEIGGRVLRGASIVRLPIPISILKLVAHTNLATSKMLGYAPMLTPGKIREITHPDWLCDNAKITQALSWQPAFGLERGLATIFDKNLKE